MELMYEQTIKLVLAVILGGVVGFEREISHKPAGLRTHMLVCMGSALLTIVSFNFFSQDYARIIAALITGMGFIGAGTTIAQGREGTHGLTTAASLWVVTALGVSVGIGWYTLSLITTILTVAILFLGRIEKTKLKSK